MKKVKLDDMVRGWFIGDFEPSVLKTKDFEIGILRHTKGEVWPAHIHKIATEYNVLLAGKMLICGEIIEPGTIFWIEPNEVGNPVFLEDCTVVTVKTPSVIGDKYNV
jgi:quercetin dioxygenase-like cupin family protein